MTKPCKLLLLLAVITYLLSLALPAFYTEYVWPEPASNYTKEAPTWYGVEVLAFGWARAFGQYQYKSFAWFANPIFWLAVFLYTRRNTLSLPIASFGLFLALTALQFRKLWSDKEPPTHLVTELGAGFYVWAVAYVILIISSLYMLWGRSRSQ